MLGRYIIRHHLKDRERGRKSFRPTRAKKEIASTDPPCGEVRLFRECSLGLLGFGSETGLDVKTLVYHPPIYFVKQIPQIGRILAKSVENWDAEKRSFVGAIDRSPLKALSSGLGVS